jgi:hypothetical protein
VPQSVISTHLVDLEELLLMFTSRPSGWDFGGQIYLDYISLAQEYGTGSRRKGNGSKKDSVARLLRAIPNMEIRSFEQRVAQAEISRVVANLVISSPELVRLKSERLI